MSERFVAQLQQRHATMASCDSLRSLQDKAWDRFALPTSKTHGYRYLNLRDLYVTSYVWDETSMEVEQEGAEILRFPEAMQAFGTYLRGRWNSLLKLERDPFALLNASLFTEALFVYVPPGKRATVVVRGKQAPETLALPRLHLFVGRGASLTLHVAAPTVAACSSGVIDLVLEDNAQASMELSAVTHNEAWLSHTVRATLKTAAQLTLSHHTNGARSVRLDADVALVGPEAEADLRGVWLLGHRRQAHTQVRIAHAAPQTRSRQLFKGALAGRAKSSFAGMIDVAENAQQTDAFQLNKNLLLSDWAAAYTRPELEVRADDVKASHGATVGRLDPDERFYLQSRGLSDQQVRQLLVRGFLADVVHAGDIESMVDDLCCGE